MSSVCTLERRTPRPESGGILGPSQRVVRRRNTKERSNTSKDTEVRTTALLSRMEDYKDLIRLTPDNQQLGHLSDTVGVLQHLYYRAHPEIELTVAHSPC